MQKSDFCYNLDTPVYKTIDDGIKSLSDNIRLGFKQIDDNILKGMRQIDMNMKGVNSNALETQEET